MYSCDFGISKRSEDELLARRFPPAGNIRSLEDLRALEAWTAAQTGADSVKYNNVDSFVAAPGIPDRALCLKCFNGISHLV